MPSSGVGRGSGALSASPCLSRRSAALPRKWGWQGGSQRGWAGGQGTCPGRSQGARPWRPVRHPSRARRPRCAAPQGTSPGCCLSARTPAAPPLPPAAATARSSCGTWARGHARRWAGPRWGLDLCRCSACGSGGGAMRARACPGPGPAYAHSLRRCQLPPTRARPACSLLPCQLPPACPSHCQLLCAWSSPANRWVPASLPPATPNTADLQRARRPGVERAVPARRSAPGVGVGRPLGLPV